MCAWSKTQKARLEFEKGIVRRYMPDFTLHINPYDAYVEGGYRPANKKTKYRLRVDFTTNYPDQVPDLLVVSPNPLKEHGGGSLNAESFSHSFHILGQGPGGCIRICHYGADTWDASKACINVLLKGVLWCEAHAAHLESGETIAYYFENPQKLHDWISRNAGSAKRSANLPKFKNAFPLPKPLLQVPPVSTPSTFITSYRFPASLFDIPPSHRERTTITSIADYDFLREECCPNTHPYAVAASPQPWSMTVPFGKDETEYFVLEEQPTKKDLWDIIVFDPTRNLNPFAKGGGKP